MKLFGFFKRLRWRVPRSVSYATDQRFFATLSL